MPTFLVEVVAEVASVARADQLAAAIEATPVPHEVRSIHATASANEQGDVDGDPVAMCSVSVTVELWSADRHSAEDAVERQVAASAAVAGIEFSVSSTTSRLQTT